MEVHMASCPCSISSEPYLPSLFLRVVTLFSLDFESEVVSGQLIISRWAR